jgi:hypothetical protein
MQSVCILSTRLLEKFSSLQNKRKPLDWAKLTLVKENCHFDNPRSFGRGLFFWPLGLQRAKSEGLEV